MTRTRFDRDQRIVTIVLALVTVTLVIENSLKIWDVAYIPIRFGLGMSASVVGVSCIIVMVFRYRIGEWPLPLVLTAASLYLVPALLDVASIRERALWVTGLDDAKFSLVVGHTLSDIVLCLVALALVSFIIKAAENTAEAREHASRLLQTNERLCDEVEERKRAEGALRESEEKYRTLFEASRDAITTASPEGGFLSGNPAAVALYGCRDEQELLQHTQADLSPEYQPDGVPSSVKAQEMMKTAMEKGSHFFEWTHKLMDGKEFPATVLLTRMEIGGRLLLQATVRDITEQKLAREAIEKSERMYRDALQVAGAVPYYQRYSEDYSSGTYEFIGKEIRTLTGYSPEEFTYGLWTSITQEVRMLGELKDLSPNEAVRKAREGKGVNWRADYRIRTRSGEEKWLANAAIQVHDDRGRLVGSLGILQDITDRRRAEAAIRESEEKYRAVVESSIDGIAIVQGTRIAFANNSLVSMFGYAESDSPAGREFLEFVAPEYRSGMMERGLARERGEQVGSRYEFEGLRKDGSRFPAEISANLITYGGRPARQGIIRDITERRQAEEEARRHQEELAHVLRVGTMGEMASELAHELNQPLSAIVNYAGGCLRWMKSGQWNHEEMMDVIEQVRLQASRAGRIVGHIREFVRKQEARLSPVDVNVLVREAVDLVGAEARRNEVPIVLELAESLPPAYADGVQIEQVILNLVRNAMDAMRDTPVASRRLTIRTQGGPDDDVKIGVCDTGCGLADEIAEKIFDAFFTTKPGGLGMGLSISRSIIESHGGRLWATPNPDGGVTFRFVVPRAEANETGGEPPREGGREG